MLPTFEPRLSRYATRELERRGVDVRTGTLVGVGRRRRASCCATAPSSRPRRWCGPRACARADARSDVARRDGGSRSTTTSAIVGAASTCTRSATSRPGTRPATAKRCRCCRRPRCRRAATSRARSCADRRRGRSATATRARSRRSGARPRSAQVGPLSFTGFVGWVVWLVVHLYYLIGFENRLRVLLRWAWYYVRLDRPVRIIARAGPSRAGRQPADDPAR